MSFLEQAQARYLQQTGDPAAAQQLAWQAWRTCATSRHRRWRILIVFGYSPSRYSR
jgi:hypothetical protein